MVVVVVVVVVVVSREGVWCDTLKKTVCPSKTSPCVPASRAQNWDNIDYRHINHLTLHTVQAMELAKHVKTQNSRDSDCLISQHFYMIDISQCVTQLALLA